MLLTDMIRNVTAVSIYKDGLRITRYIQLLYPDCYFIIDIGPDGVPRSLPDNLKHIYDYTTRKVTDEEHVDYYVGVLLTWFYDDLGDLYVNN